MTAPGSAAPEWRHGALRAFVLGLPGSGSAASARIIADRYQVPLFQLDTALRFLAESSQEFGAIARSALDAPWDAIPDAILHEMLQPVLPDTRRGGWVIEGFPLSVGQMRGMHFFTPGEVFVMDFTEAASVAHLAPSTPDSEHEAMQVCVHHLAAQIPAIVHEFMVCEWRIHRLRTPSPAPTDALT